MMMMEADPQLPIRLSLINGRYFSFSIQEVSYLRREHQICGVLIGTIPQSPSQNVFLGLPVELMAEEVQLLVSKGIAYVSDDVKAHQSPILEQNAEGRKRYLDTIQSEGLIASKANLIKKEQQRKRSLKKNSANVNEDNPNSNPASLNKQSTPIEEQAEDMHASLFKTTSGESQTSLKPIEMQNYGITPATSQDLLPPTPPEMPSTLPLAELPPSYPLFKHLNTKGYFLSPGLRFGCQYTVYPGDPLRFHSHFLASSAGWDEEIDLMDIVGGGRLGTGVKKGFLIGGADLRGDVKTFSIEWAGM